MSRNIPKFNFSNQYPPSEIVVAKRKFNQDKIPRELYLFSATKICTYYNSAIILFLHGAFLIKSDELSQVRMGLNLANNQLLIIKLKKILVNKPLSQASKYENKISEQCFRNELLALKIQKRLIQCGFFYNYYFLITPFIKIRSLWLILQQDYLTEIEKLKLSITIGLTLLDLRKMGIIYGDLSLDHILVSRENLEKIDIIDFDVAYIKNNPINIILTNCTSGFYPSDSFGFFSENFILTEPEQCQPQPIMYRGLVSDEAHAFGYLMLKLFFPFLEGRYKFIDFIHNYCLFNHSQLILQILKVIRRLTQKEPWCRINLLSAIWWLIYIYEFFKGSEPINHSLPELSTLDKWKLIIESHSKFHGNEPLWTNTQYDKMPEIVSIDRDFSTFSSNLSYKIKVKEWECDDSEFSPYFFKPYFVIKKYTIQYTANGLKVFKFSQEVRRSPSWISLLLTDPTAQTSLEILKPTF